MSESECSKMENVYNTLLNEKNKLWDMHMILFSFKRKTFEYMYLFYMDNKELA